MYDDSKPAQNGQTIWDRVAESHEFKDLMATKKIIIIPAFLFFLVYYFLLPILVGYAPKFMDIKFGATSISHIFSRSRSSLWHGPLPVCTSVPVTISMKSPKTSSKKQ